jgi:hypothetical protein
MATAPWSLVSVRGTGEIFEKCCALRTQIKLLFKVYRTKNAMTPSTPRLDGAQLSGRGAHVGATGDATLGRSVITAVFASRHVTPSYGGAFCTFR